MYPVVLAIHNIFRWVVLILCILAVVRAYLGWLGRRDWVERDRKIGSFFAMGMDIQFLLGLVLYFFLSPLTRSAFQDFGAAMGSPEVRFFALEHILYMVAAVVFAHLGSVLPRRASSSAAKYQRAAVCFSLALLAIILGMPWMRPLLPGLS
jgi:uncharacterized membrane protein YozB (DUF420 family)